MQMDSVNQQRSTETRATTGGFTLNCRKMELSISRRVRQTSSGTMVRHSRGSDTKPSRIARAPKVLRQEIPTNSVEGGAHTQPSPEYRVS